MTIRGTLNQILIAFKKIQLPSCARKKPRNLHEVINLPACAKDVPDYLSSTKKNHTTFVRYVSKKIFAVINIPDCARAAQSKLHLAIKLPKLRLE
jgi:hypothetical protein